MSVCVLPAGVGSPACSPACSSHQREVHCNCSSAAPGEEEANCPESVLSCSLAGPDKERMRLETTTLEIITVSCRAGGDLSRPGDGVQTGSSYWPE